MGYDAKANVQEGETVTGSDSKAGNHRIHLVQTGTWVEPDVPEAGQFPEGSWCWCCPSGIERGPTAGQLGDKAEVSQEEGAIKGGTDT